MVASLHKHKKGVWHQFPFITQVGKIENFKQTREEVSILSSYKFQEVSFRRHDPQEKLKEHLQQVGFQWSYSHENLFPGELSQQQVLFKSRIPTQDQMPQIDKEEEKKKDIKVNSKTLSGKLSIVRIDDKESSSSSSMSLYNIESNEKHSEVSSQRTPTMIENQVPEQLDEFYSSLTADKNQFERHSQIQQAKEDQLNYNIDEVFKAFMFNLCKQEVSRKRIGNVRQNDGTYKEVQEDEILFESIEEDRVIVATTSTPFPQATVHNVNVLSEKLSQAKSDNHKLKEDITNLKAEIHKRRKVDDETTSLQETILDQHAKIYDVRMECFDKVKKMVDKVKMIEKHLDIVSQTH